MVNAVMGYGMVTPFEVMELPEDWMLAFEGLAMKLPDLRKSVAEVERLKNEWRQNYRQRYMQ